MRLLRSVTTRASTTTRSHLRERTYIPSTSNAVRYIGGRVKKEDAVEAIEQAGNTIHDLNVRVWTTALNPREHGWGSTLLSIAAIPIVNAASIGQMVTSVIVKEVPASVFDTVSNLGGKKEP